MTYVWAFLVGGLLCAAGQILLDRTKLTPARILVGYVVCGVLLGALGIYPKLLGFAGAGTSVLLSGFGNLLAEGIRDTVDKEGLLGVLTGGISAAMLFGLLAAVCFHPKEK